MIEEGAQGFLLLQAGHHVAGVGDQEIGGGERFEVGIVFEDAHPHTLVFGEQLEQFEPGEVGILDNLPLDNAGKKQFFEDNARRVFRL